VYSQVICGNNTQSQKGPKVEVTESETSGQSNLTQDRIAAADGRFNSIRQVAPMCTPYIV